MSIEDISCRLDAGVRSLFDEKGQLSDILEVLSAIDEAQQNASSVGKDKTVDEITRKLSIVLDSMRDISRAQETRMIGTGIKID